MSDLLTILIPTLPRRKHFFTSLMTNLIDQVLNAGSDQVLILFDDSTDCSIGVKRNRLMARVSTPYMAFFDDDDKPGETYIASLLRGIETEPDCCSLNGIITEDGLNPKIFKHSIEYTSMYESDGIYYRPPNHINCLRTDLAKQCPFPNWNTSEDSNFCHQLLGKGLLKKEYKIEEIIYHYLYRRDKKILG